MSSKSTVIPLGIDLKNENKLDEMVEIVDRLHKYVPTVTRTEMFEMPLTDELISIRADYFHHITFGGDQLTSARIRGAQRLRSNSEHPRGRLEGFAAVTEDWHAKVCLMAVIWKTLLRKGSSQDVGTLLQLKHVLNRTNLPSKPKSDMNACEDFLEVVTVAHIIAACMEILGMQSIDDEPDPTIVPSDLKFKEKNKKEEVLSLVTKKIVDSFINLSILKKAPQSTCKRSDCNVDGVLKYAQELLTLSLLYAEFHDSIREGDGLRILRCWKFLLLVFKAGLRKNYSIEAFTLLAQYHILFPERMAQQLIWSRCVNTQGKPGHNIPCDLHMEHCNRLCKVAVQALGANVAPKSLTRVGKVSGALLNVLTQYDSSCFVPPPSTAHTGALYEKDLKLILKEITEHTRVFHYTTGRKHGAFKSLKGSLLEKLEWKAMQQWMQEQFNKLTG